MKLRCTFVSLFLIGMISVMNVALTSQESITLKKLAICNCKFVIKLACKEILTDLRKEKNSNIRDMPNYDKVTVK